jgi:hypothetical protein
MIVPIKKSAPELVFLDGYATQHFLLTYGENISNSESGDKTEQELYTKSDFVNNDILKLKEWVFTEFESRGIEYDPKQLDEIAEVLFKLSKTFGQELISVAAGMILDKGGKIIRKDALGNVMHPLEIEVENMIALAQSGKEVVPQYSKPLHKTPIDYVEKYFGKYLNYFNGGKGDYLFLDQLGKVVPDIGFKSTFVKYIKRHYQTYKSPVVHPLSARLDMQARHLTDSQISVNKKVVTLGRRCT